MKRQSKDLSPFEAGLHAAGLMAEMDRAYLAEDEERFLSANESLNLIKPHCDAPIQEYISKASETTAWKSSWKEIQNDLLHWLSRHRKTLHKALADADNIQAPKDLMSLIWIFLDGMDNPEWISSGINSEFWGFCKNKKEFQEVLPQFILAYYYLIDKQDVMHFKNDIDFFHKMMPVTYRQPQPPEPDFFGQLKENLSLYISDYFSSDALSWPNDWSSPQTYLKRALQFFKS